MKRVVSIRRLREFRQSHPDAETPLRTWFKVASKAKWRNLQDVRRAYPNADGVEVASGATMTVFNTGGNKYRLVTSIWYGGQQIYIKLVLTHAEYDKNKWKRLL